MNIYIMTDIEGISGIYCREQVMRDQDRFGEGRSRMTADVNACAAGLKAAGAEKVYVRDCNGGSFSLIYDQLSDDIDYAVCGEVGQDRFYGIEDCDAAVFLGYHAMAGTSGAVLEHTLNSTCIQNYWVNGRKVGEFAIDAGILGDKGIPVIMVSGDDKLCAEARSFSPEICTAQVKRGISCFGSVLLPPKQAYKVIFDTAREACNRIGEILPLVFDKPVCLRAEVTERTQLPPLFSKPYMRILDGRTYEVTAETMEEALYRL